MLSCLTWLLAQVFVDEFTCIGCRNCTNVCSNTFKLEDDYGRARVVSQRSTDIETKQEAIDTCPVSTSPFCVVLASTQFLYAQVLGYHQRNVAEMGQQDQCKTCYCVR